MLIHFHCLPFQKLDYQWYHTGTLVTEGNVEALSWNQDGKLTFVLFVFTDAIAVHLKEEATLEAIMDTNALLPHLDIST